MNIHHLELFYYVARHGGIVPAVRNMPYGIQQPAVSGQIARLEETLGTKLFNRRPFALLPPGIELYKFIRPFFDEIDHVGFAAGPLISCAWPRPPSSCTITSRRFCGASENI